MPPPIVLLPPSEGKRAGGTGDPFVEGSLRFAELDTTRRATLAALKRDMRANTATAGRLLGVKGTALAAARLANREAAIGPTMSAIERYTGVLYRELDVATLSTRDRRRADGRLIIFSGLWGLLTPSDPIPDYKLKMGAGLSRLGKLSTMWRPHISAALAPIVANATVWDLLPGEHAAAWTPPVDTRMSRIVVTFLDDKPAANGGRSLVAVSHWNKLLKGALVRHILRTDVDRPDGLSCFDHPLGYQYRPELTVERGGATHVSLVARRD